MVAWVFLAIRILIAVLLYAFVAWAVVTMWRTVRQLSLQVQEKKIPPLTIIEGCNGEKRYHRFQEESLIIGRDSACNFPINDRTISARHARITYHHAQWWLEDLGSRNGTFINQERISQPVALASGDEVLCGKVCLLVQIGATTSQEEKELNNEE